MKNVLITTKHRGVFFAQVEENTDLTGVHLTNLKNCKMAIKFGTTKGVMQLCETGPTELSLISATADLDVLHGVTAVFSLTDEATKKWMNA